jgi:hypothetical protein
MPHPARPGPAAAILCRAIPEVCPPGEGMVWSGRAAFADVAPLRELQLGFDGRYGHLPRKPGETRWRCARSTASRPPELRHERF